MAFKAHNVKITKLDKNIEFTIQIAFSYCLCLAVHSQKISSSAQLERGEGRLITSFSHFYITYVLFCTRGRSGTKFLALGYKNCKPIGYRVGSGPVVHFIQEVSVKI